VCATEGLRHWNYLDVAGNVAVFAATCRKRQAEWAERAARAKGDSNNVAANPQKCA
jgi:hypothetical protein